MWAPAPVAWEQSGTTKTRGEAWPRAELFSASELLEKPDVCDGWLTRPRNRGDTPARYPRICALAGLER